MWCEKHITLMLSHLEFRLISSTSSSDININVYMKYESTARKTWRRRFTFVLILEIEKRTAKEIKLKKKRRSKRFSNNAKKLKHHKIEWKKFPSSYIFLPCRNAFHHTKTTKWQQNHYDVLFTTQQFPFSFAILFLFSLQKIFVLIGKKLGLKHYFAKALFSCRSIIKETSMIF